MKNKAALAVIQNAEGKYLLQKRDKNPVKNPLKWAFFGGGVEGDESLVDAVVREVYEETELVVHSESVEHLCTVESKDEDRYYFIVNQHVKESDVVLHEGESFGFFTPSEAQKLDIYHEALDIMMLHAQK